MKLTLLSAMLLAASAGASLANDCDPLRPNAPRNISQEMAGKIDAKVDGFARRILSADANVDGTYKQISSDVLKEYPNADQLYLWERTLYLFCITIEKSGLTGSEKMTRIDGLMDRLKQPPSVRPTPGEGPRSLNQETPVDPDNQVKAALRKYLGIAVGDKRLEKVSYKPLALNLNPDFPNIGPYESAEHRYLKHGSVKVLTYSRPNAKEVSLIVVESSSCECDGEISFVRDMLTAIARDSGYKKSIQMSSNVRRTFDDDYIYDETKTESEILPLGHSVKAKYVQTYTTSTTRADSSADDQSPSYEVKIYLTNE